MQASDQDIFLWTRIKEGDRQSFNALFAQYYNRLCALSNTIVKNKEDAEEVVLDVFFTIWKSRHTLVIQHIQSYLYSSVKYASMACVRKRRVHLRITDDLTDHIGLATHDVYAVKELSEHIDKAVDQLPMRCKQVFIMNRFHGMGYREISQALGISEKTVEHHLARGVQYVRQFTSQYYNGSDSAIIVS